MALIDNLLSYWKCDEASGDLLDAHGSVDLTDTNTVGSATGIINNGRDYELSNSEYHTATDPNSLDFGDEDFSISLWFNMETASNTLGLLWKGNPDFSQAGYRLRMTSVAGFPGVRFQVRNTTTGTVTSSVSFSASTWVHIVAWHDSVGNEIGVRWNDSAQSTTSHSNGCAANALDFEIGRAASSGAYFDGIIDEVGIWDKVLSSSEITDLYNSGSGLAYPFSAGGTTIPIFERHYRQQRMARCI